MRFFIRTFFRTLRVILGPFILLNEMLTTPRGIVRSSEDQQKLDQKTKNLVLYQFKTCPFCVKVRRTIASLSLKIETRDTQRDPVSREQLLLGGGIVKVPCLRVTEKDGKVTWVYESEKIVKYLQEGFA